MLRLLICFLLVASNAHAYMGYQSNRFLPFLVPTAFVDNCYQVGLSNIGASNVLLSNGTVYAIEPAIAGIDCGVRKAWTLLGNKTFSGKIAIISTGVATTHPDLTNVLTGVTCNFTNLTQGQNDQGAGAGEGTAVAGIIAGAGSKDVDDGHICGIMPGAKILPISVAASQIAHSNAWNYALTNGAKILVLPWGYTSDWDNGSMRLLCQRSLNSNCVVVQAAPDNGFYYGSINDNTNNWDFPGSLYPIYPNIIAATVLSYDGTIPANAAKGTYLVAAPGRRLASTGRPGYSQYVYANGTSFSAPHVAGAVALIWAYHPTESAVQICARIRNNLDYLEGCAGSLNIGRAICAECPVVRPPFVLSLQGNVLVIDSSDTVIVQQSPNLVDWALFTNVVGPIRIPLDLDGKSKFFRAFQRLSTP